MRRGLSRRRWAATSHTANQMGRRDETHTRVRAADLHPLGLRGEGRGWRRGSCAGTELEKDLESADSGPRPTAVRLAEEPTLEAS